MDQTSYIMRLRIKVLVSGDGAFIISINLLFIEVLFGFAGLGGVIIVMFLSLFIKIWNKIGLLSSWCYIHGYVFMIYCDEVLLRKIWKCGNIWYSIFDYFFLS